MALPSMSSKHLKILTDNADYLRTEIEAERVSYHLLSAGIFDQEHINEIKAEKTPQKKAGMFLEILHRRGNRAFEELIKGLDKKQPHLAEFLRQEEIKADPVSNSSSSTSRHFSDQVDSDAKQAIVQEDEPNCSVDVFQQETDRQLQSPLIPFRGAPTITSEDMSSIVSSSDSSEPCEQELSDTESGTQTTSDSYNFEQGVDVASASNNNSAADEGDGPLSKLFKKSKSKGKDLVDKALIPNYQFERTLPRPSIYGAAVDGTTIYKMDTNIRGKALIINNKTFTVPPVMHYPRKGTDIDAFALEKLFTDLKFKVYLEHNKTVNQIRDLLWKHTKNTDHRQYSSFVFIVLSHGLEGKVYGTDNTIDIKELAIMARDTETLVGKPKLFFIQACQGTEFMKGRDVVDAPSGNLLFALPEQPEEKIIQLPIEADFLYAYSTVPGYYSWRNVENGSWFIQKVIKVFYQHAKHMDIVRMLTRVNGLVAKKKSDANQTMQIPTIVSHLRKELYFFPEEMTVTDNVPDPFPSGTPPPRQHTVTGRDCVDNRDSTDGNQGDISESNNEVVPQNPHSGISDWFRCNIM